MTARLHVSAGSESCPVDTPVHLLATGFPPSAAVRLTATMEVEGGQLWTSWAEFTADCRGTVDLAATAARAGTYRGVDGMGLFWSMSPRPAADGGRTRFQIRTFTPMRVALTATCARGLSATADVVRTVLPSGVASERVDDPDGDGVAGVMFTPTGPGPHPVAVLLAGSSGGVSAAHAALLAGHGLATLALSYFGTGALPRVLAGVPLEFWDRAVAWLARRPECDVGRLALIGSSKGAELALLLASRRPADVTAVVGYAPSGVVYQGIPRFEGDDWPQPAPRSSWTAGGTELPFVPFTLAAGGGGGPWVGPSAAHPISMREMHERPLESICLDHPAVIAAERITAPVLLISGTADSVWPSTWHADLVLERAARAGGQLRMTHLRYPGAGHSIGIPHLPTFGFDAFGGTPRADAEASIDSWSRVAAFLDRELRIDGPLHHSVHGAALETEPADDREGQDCGH